jgi:hypothetical protein
MRVMIVLGVAPFLLLGLLILPVGIVAAPALIAGMF